MSKAPQLFLNRELSWLEFNNRVLEEAMDPTVPLLERLKFLAITSSNLDEFFMVRVGGLQQLLEEGKNRFDPAGLTTSRQLAEISRRTHRLVADQYTCLQEELEVLMERAGIRRLTSDHLEPAQYEFLNQVFEHELYPVITPMALQSPASFPSLPGLGINLLVQLAPARKSSKTPRFAIIPIPRRLNRFINLPAQQGYAFVLLEEAVTIFVNRIFPGEPIVECVPFRITRNADMSVREDVAFDLLQEMRSVLEARKNSACVRLDVHARVSKTSLDFLQNALRVRDEHIYKIPGPIDLSAFGTLARITGFDDYKDKPWTPQPPPEVRPNETIFETLARQDLLLYHPYDSFEPVTRLVVEAATDPDVLAIKQILYRTSQNSPIVRALAQAAAKGKHVTVIVELKARFDEARNIEWARELEQAGVQVIYGLVGLKTHAKICIVVRREAAGIRRYLHFGTGNYNDVTARLYSDVSYMTCQEDLGADSTTFFNTITGYSQPVKYRKLDAAPISLRSRLLELIESETLRRQQGQKASIMAKLNSLVDPEIIRALCRASQAGVKIQLNIRGICCLRPGVPGLSDNITVTSVIDRFLEHSRLFYFHHGGESLVFISSADWMPRNLDRRVELFVPVEDRASQARIISILRTSFRDNVKARRLLPDGRYERLAPGPSRPLRSQQTFCEEASARAKEARRQLHLTFTPALPSTTPD